MAFVTLRSRGSAARRALHRQSRAIIRRETHGGKSGQYELSVNVVSLSKPSIGISFTVDMKAGWTLTRVSDRQIVLRKAIASTHMATMGAAFAGVERLRLAVEGAARANIAHGLAAIGQLDL